MEDIVIRECARLSEFDQCVRLQRQVFGLEDLEVSPQRHLIVSRQAGGWTLGAFVQDGNQERLVGFVHHLAAVLGDEIFGYSHMMAVDQEFQNRGLGARLKWSQRERALEDGRKRIRWTWDPMQARNAHFNLNRLGVTVSSYAENFYGTDYVSRPVEGAAEKPGIDSDRIFADWRISSPRVMAMARREAIAINESPAQTIVIPAKWSTLMRSDPATAKGEQLRVRSEFQNAFAEGLVAAGFERSEESPRYLLYESSVLDSQLKQES